MNKGTRISVSGLTALQTAGIREILSSCLPYCEIVKEARDADAHIVTAAEFVSDLQFYLPRKDVTLIMDSDKSSKVARSVVVDASETELAEAFVSLVENISYTNLNDTAGLALSKRELDVLRLIATGKTTKQIAEVLFISVNTVLTHRKNISSKLNIRSASGLSLYALMNGLL